MKCERATAHEGEGEQMAAVTVTMQMNVGANEAGDWASRRAGRTATGTGWMLARTDAMGVASNELMIRLHGLRGAVEAMRSEPTGPTLSHNHSTRSCIGYGNPIGYRGMRFITRVAG